MAEAAVALFSMLGSAVAGAGAAATSALGWGLGTTVTTAAGATEALGAGSLASLAASGSSALSILQGAATAASVASTLLGGAGAIAEGNQQAELAKLQGNADFIASEERALNIQRDLVQKIGKARVAFAGSGLDISSGDAVESDLRSQAAFETEIEKQNAQSRLAQAALRAKRFRSNGEFDLASSLMKAGGQAAGFGLDIAKRG